MRSAILRPTLVLRARPSVRRLTTGALERAASDLAHLPELADAHARYAAADFGGALAPLERALQIVEGFPAPAMQLVVRGGLAQLLRATGDSEREAALWRELVAQPVAQEPPLRLHALNGAASCALHRGEHAEALATCKQAFAALESEQAGGELRARWTPTFLLHRALGSLASGGDDAAAAAAAEATAAAIAAAAARALAAVPGDSSAAEEVAALLLGDALAVAGDTAGALEAWGALTGGAEGGAGGGGEDEAAAAGGGGSAGGGGGVALLRRHAALCRVGTVRLAAVPAAAAADAADAGADAAAAAEPGGLAGGIASLKAAVALEAQLLSPSKVVGMAPSPPPGAVEAAVARSLSLLAGAFALNEEPLAAEGLHRSAVDRLRAALLPLPSGADGTTIVVTVDAGAGGGGTSPPRRAALAEAAALASSLESFAETVGAIEWNAKPRTAEAAQLRAEAAELRRDYTPLLRAAPLGATAAAYAAAGPACAAHAHWGGLEPWYAASLQPDWLGACADTEARLAL